MRAPFVSVTLGLCLSIYGAEAQALPAYRPGPDELLASYKRAESLRADFTKAYHLRIDAHWYSDGDRFWYQDASQGGERDFFSVDAATGKKTPLFDNDKLANALKAEVGHPVDSTKMDLRQLSFDDKKRVLRFRFDGGGYECDLNTYALTLVTLPGQVRNPRSLWDQPLWPADVSSVRSPDGKWTVRCDQNNVMAKQGAGAEFQLTNNGSSSAYYARLQWTPDSKYVIATTVAPGDRRSVYLTVSGAEGERASMEQFIYDLPGDKTDHFQFWILDPAAHTVEPVDGGLIDYGEMPYITWNKDKTRFRYDRMDRGYSRWRIFEVDPATATQKTLIDEHPSTFFDSTSMYSHYCKQTDEIIWRSERSGWGQLYLTDASGQGAHPITHGDWVVRGVESVDEKARQIVFEASGMNVGEDPYFIHYYRVNFDGSGLTPLTPAPGNHHAQFSPDGKYMIDTYSTIETPPVHELRNAMTGALVSPLGKADISSLSATGWKAPEVFVAKGRDDKTDMWGIVYRPRNLDPNKSYPIIEDIYAGPQDSFVPKDFAPYRGDEALAELGFIVVQVDGMGTRNRSKAFQDVCFKNLADSGFPDRIKWMKALAANYPYMDISRVGIFGTSAGGQESTAAMLFHPEFYKVAVSSCGCHDNRMDKLWWNEQWMGYPIGPEYAEQSNITNASKLQGNLMLIVGELDTNVPPASTYRLVDALEKSGKNFDFLVIPGSDHTNGGPFGEHKRRDFLVHHLLGVEPPSWSAVAAQ